MSTTALPLVPAATPVTAALPLLVVGHGTRSAEGAAEFSRLTERVRARARGLLPAVDGGFIELARPSVAEAVSRMAASEIVAVPLVLTAAGHGKGDIPAALAREQTRHRGLRYRYGRPLGPHPVLLRLLEARIDAALGSMSEPEGRGASSHGATRRGTHVVLVGRGSTDPDANAEVAKVARLLWEGRGYDAVELSFISLAEPPVPAALERVRRLGARRIVVAPYFLFPGVLPDRVAAQAREFAARHPALDIRVAGLIGDCDELAGLVLERYHEAVHGDIRMNCDTCAYRVALPGYADKVGRPQTPHHHPADGDAESRGPRDRGPRDHGPRDHGPRDHGAGDTGAGLDYHGDQELAPGLTDLAVNVWRPRPPEWLHEELAASLGGLAPYPDPAPARAAVAARHGREPDEVLLTAGAAEAFVLLARALRPRCAAIVHPQFTAPEAALRAAGHQVHRVILDSRGGFRLTGATIPDQADLVMVGNPANPTSVLHPAAELLALARPGRVLVVDEAFMDAVPAEPESLAGRRDVPGLVVVRSLTKSWGLAGLRIGYLLGPADLLRRLRRAQPPWAVSTPALAAARACSTTRALAAAAAAAAAVVRHRAHLASRLDAIPGVRVVPGARGPFLLLHVSGGGGVRQVLRDKGFAVRRGDTFPGLGPDWLRVAVREPAVSDAFADTLSEVLS